MIKDFFKYRKQWIDDTDFSSSGGYDHPALKKIIQMGDKILPIIFIDLSYSTAALNPIHWFYALHEITGKNPIQDDNLGDIYQMALDWLEWGQLNEYSTSIDLKINK